MVIKLNMMTDAGNSVSTAYSAVLILVAVAVIVVAVRCFRGSSVVVDFAFRQLLPC